MQDLLTTAIELHQAGQFDPAAQLYQQILACNPENADALHMLGVLRHQCGDHVQAVALMSKAVVLCPSVPSFHANLAEAHRTLGQFEQAADCCRTALRLCPEYPEAHCNLGLALQGQGRPGEACEHFRRALQLRPEFAAAHSNIGIALVELGEPDAALPHFRRALELDPNSASARTNFGQALLERGLILQREGQFSAARICLNRAVELGPTQPIFWENLAELHGDQDEPAEAIRCWQHVLALQPERPKAHNGLGWALQEDGRLDEAARHFRAALRLQPDYALPQLNLGGVHEELGELAEAETAFRTALRMQPAFALPHARLATLLRGKLPAADQAALEERLADANLEDGPRARLLFGLAQVLDARGDYFRAAELLRQANALTLELARRQKREYAPADHQRFVDGLIREFGPAFFARLAGTGHDTRRPVFVFGLPRSGTTLIEQVLASHSRIHGAGELRLARHSFEAIPAVTGCTENSLDCVLHLDGKAIRTLADRHLELLSALDGSHAAHVVDKMPDNYMYVGLLAAMFPGAVFIHCRRDLRDVAVSCWMTDFRTIRWANAFEHIATRFEQYRRLMSHWQAVLPMPIHVVNYEDTVADLERVARRLVAACGLEWEPRCLEFHRTRRPVRTASVGQVRQPIYTRSVARWKNYESALAGLHACLPTE